MKACAAFPTLHALPTVFGEAAKKWLNIDECTCKSISQTTIGLWETNTGTNKWTQTHIWGVLVLVCLSRFQLCKRMFIFDLSQMFVFFLSLSQWFLDRLSVQRPKNEVIHLKPLTLQRKLGTCTNCNGQMQAIIAGVGERVPHPLHHLVFLEVKKCCSCNAQHNIERVCARAWHKNHVNPRCIQIFPSRQDKRASSTSKDPHSLSTK